MSSWVHSTKLTGSGTAVAVLLVGLAATANADTIYVCWDDSGDYLTIQEGIDAAQDLDEVVVCNGTYTGSGNKDLDFHGKAITVRSASGDPDLCIIDCEASDSDPHRGFYLHSGETAVVDGFTITNGYSSDDGGGVYCFSSSPTITNCTFSGNSAYYSGGGVYCSSSSPTITNCTFSGNSAYKGGAVYCWQESSPTITNCTFSGNSAYDYYGDGDGGGIYCSWGSPTIRNCVISGNSTRDQWWGLIGSGGGISCSGSSPSIVNCTISENESEVAGGLHCTGNSTPTVVNCTIRANTSQVGGGMLCDWGSSLKVANCVIVGNRAEGHVLGYGGAVYHQGV